MFLAGLALTALPVRRARQLARSARDVGPDGTSVVGISRDANDDEARETAPPGGPATRSWAAPEVEIGEPDASDTGFSPPVRSVVHVRAREPIRDLTARFVTDHNLGGTTDLGHTAFHVSTSSWRIRSEHRLRSVRDVIIGYTSADRDRRTRRFQWDGHDREYDSSAPGADGSHLSALLQIKQAIRAEQDANAGAMPGPARSPRQPIVQKSD